MSFTEVLPRVQSLSRQDKIQLMEFLARELDGGDQTFVEPGKTYPIGSFQGQYKAAADLMKFLEKEKSER